MEMSLDVNERLDVKHLGSEDRPFFRQIVGMITCALRGRHAFEKYGHPPYAYQKGNHASPWYSCKQLYLCKTCGKYAQSIEEKV
jgi:hypothetical protein